MHRYIPHTKKDTEEMFSAIGIESIDELFADIPENVRFKGEYDLVRSLCDVEVTEEIDKIAKKNRIDMIPFIGAGAYDHYIPSTIQYLTSRSEFATAYTPYQPEVAQGTLQYIYEFQSLMTNLCNMDVSNASMYDASTALAEACMMMNNATKRNKVIISDTVSPNYVKVAQTYGKFRGFEVIVVPSKDGTTDAEKIKLMLDKTVSGVITQTPNFYGIIENSTAISEACHEVKALSTIVVNPLAQAVVKSAGSMQSDIVVGDAQPLGIPLSFGGAYLGFMLTTKKLMRKLPGRICGLTKDIDGNRAFVLTLQAREQHIRREKANSNICSNQSLNVLAATIFLTTLGKVGLIDMADQNYQKAHYALDKIVTLDKFERVYEADFFNEFVVKSKIDYAVIKEKLEKNNILPGLHLGDNKILFCVTEKRSATQIDKLFSLLGEL